MPISEFAHVAYLLLARAKKNKGLGYIRTLLYF